MKLIEALVTEIDAGWLLQQLVERGWKWGGLYGSSAKCWHPRFPDDVSVVEAAYLQIGLDQEGARIIMLEGEEWEVVPDLDPPALLDHPIIKEI